MILTSDKNRIIDSINAVKIGVTDVVGIEKAEAFVGKHIETLLDCLFKGMNETETMNEIIFKLAKEKGVIL